MKTFYNLLASFLLIFCSFGIQPVLTYSWHSSTELRDLEYSGSSFIAELDEWSCPLLINSTIKYSVCSGSYIMGGYNIMGGSGTTGSSAYYGNYWTRYYGGIGIPAHNQVNVTYTVYAIDSWDGTTSDDHYSTSVDGNMITCWHFSSFAGYGSALCGITSYKDYTVRAYLTFPHTALDMTLTFTNYLDQKSSDESLGIRDIQINFVNVTTPATSICGTSTMTPLSTWACACSSTNQYMSPPNSGTCFSCDASCTTCSAGTATDCTSCETGYYLSGGQCLQCSSNCATCSGTATTCTTCNSDWFMVENTCYSSCDPPLQQETVGSVVYCETPCPGEYIMWNGSCSPTCNYTTFTFSAATVNTFKECSYPCSSDEYFYFNGSCLSTCPSPLTDLSYYGEGLCDYSCSSSDYLYWNGSCLSTCPSPLSEETQGTNLTRQFCWYTCQPDQYLYWNGSCIETCPSPLSGETQGTYLERNFCWYTCQPDEYLYWNGSCLDSCLSPLAAVTEGNPSRQFCYYLCSVDEFLYWDGSCQTSCDFPLVSNVEGSPERQFCFYLCNTSDYLYWNGTCSSSCDPPLIQSTSNGRNYCNHPCKSDEYLAWYIYEDGSCEKSCSYPYQSRTEDGYQYCDKTDGGFLKETFLLAPTEAGATSLVCLVKIMHYIRYLDIEMSTRLEGLVQSQPRNILTLQYGATMPNKAIDGFGEYSLIPVFEKPGNHSSFFVNYFQTFTSIAIGFFAGFCLQLLERLSMKRGYKTWQAIFEVLRVIFKWNFCLILLAFNIDFIILYSFLEFGTAERSLGSGLPNFSLATDILMILTGVIFLIGLIYLIRKIYKITTRVAPEPSANAVSAQENQDYLIVTGKWQGFRVLFTGFKETSNLSRYFYLIYTIRIGLPIILACGLYHFPMIQTTLQVNISIAILVFIIIVKPIKKKINMMQLILFETLALMMNFCIFILTAINTYNYDAQNSRVRLGDAVIIGNSLINLLSLIFLVVKLYLELKTLIPLLPKMTKHEKYASFAKLFLILVQQGAMGFESIFDELTPTNSTRNPHIDQTAIVATETSLKNSPRIKRRGAAFPTLSTEGDLQTQGDNTFDDYARTTRRLKDMTPGTARIFNDNASQIGLKDNFSQIAGGRASAFTEDPSYLGIQGDTSPTLRRRKKNFSSAARGTGGNSKTFTPQKNFEPSFSQNNESSPGNNNKFRSNIQKESYYNYNISGGNNNGNQGVQNQNTSIHPFSASSALSLDISDNSPQMRQPGFGNRHLDRTGTNLLASGTSKIYEEERGTSEVDDQLDRKAARWNFSYNAAASQNLERDYSFPIEEDIHSKMQRKATWHYWKAKGREKKPEKSVFEYSDVTITKK